MGQEYIANLKKARERLVADRRACVQTLVEVPERATSIEAFAVFKSLQETILAIDRAIRDEKSLEKECRYDEMLEEIRRRSKKVTGT